MRGCPSFARFRYWHDDGGHRRGLAGPAFTVGDLGRIDDDGYLYLDGRRDDLIITGGVNVYPAEVEAVLRRGPGGAARWRSSGCPTPPGASGSVRPWSGSADAQTTGGTARRPVGALQAAEEYFRVGRVSPTRPPASCAAGLRRPGTSCSPAGAEPGTAAAGLSAGRPGAGGNRMAHTTVNPATGETEQTFEPHDARGGRGRSWPGPPTPPSYCAGPPSPSGPVGW